MRKLEYRKTIWFAAVTAVSSTMTRNDVVARIKAVEPALRARGIASLYLFGSYSRDETTDSSDIDVFVDAGSESFYELSNFVGAYDDLREALPAFEIGYSTRNGLSKYIRAQVEAEAVRIF